MRVVIFDLFGTLVKPESDELAHREFAEYLTKKYGVDGAAFLSLYNRYEAEGMLPRDALLRAIRELLPSIGEEEVGDILRKHAEFHAAFTIPYEDAVRAVSIAKERVGHIAVVTDAEKDVAESVLASIGILQLIDAVVASDDAGERKPSPKPFVRALELLGTSPESAASIGDSCKDVDGSRSAGIKAILVKRSDSELGCEARAFLVASSLVEAVERAVNLLLGH